MGAATFAIAAISLANVPRHISLSGQRELESLRPAAVKLIDTATERVDAATVLYRPSPNYDVFGVPLLARLQRKGVDFVVADPVLVRQFGERRRDKGEAVTELRVVTAMEAVDAASSPNAIAFASDLSEGELSELQKLAFEIEVWLLEGRITLSDTGETTVDTGFGDEWLRQLGGPELDATSVSRSNSLATAIQFGLIDADPQISTALARFATLRRVVETSTVIVLLVPPI